MKTGILFDLDGTLLDTLEDLLDATNYALAAYGHPPRTLRQLRRFVGNGAENQIRLSLPEDHKEDLPKVLAVYKPYYTAHCQIKTKPYGGILPVLKALGETYPIAIVSNKPDSAVKALCADYFPGIYALGETAGCPRKDSTICHCSCQSLPWLHTSLIFILLPSILRKWEKTRSRLRRPWI